MDETLHAILELRRILKTKMEGTLLDTEIDDYEFQQLMAEFGEDYCDE